MRVPKLQAVRILMFQCTRCGETQVSIGAVGAQGAPAIEGTCLVEAVDAAYEETAILLLSKKGEPSSFCVYFCVHAYML